jgi:hypothetical protein
MNIKLVNGQTNRWVMPISEAVTLTSTTVYFLFKLTDHTTNDDSYFTAPDISTNIINHNEFSITLTGSAYTNLTAGTISLHKGRYDYRVYEMEDASNLSITGTTGTILKQGIVSVFGETPETHIDSEYTGSTISYTYYDPNA